MHHDNEDDVLLGKRITIRGKISKQSLPNIGSFGRKLISNDFLLIVPPPTDTILT